MESSQAPRGSMAKPLTAIIIIGLLLLAFALDAQRRRVQAQLQQFTEKYEQLTGNQEQNAEEAKKIVDSVRRLIKIPEGVDPTVATVVKVEELRKINAFYKNAENGDNLVVTNERAYLYRPSEDILVDVVPVQIEAPPQEAVPPASSSIAPARRPAPPPPPPAEPAPEGAPADAAQ